MFPLYVELPPYHQYHPHFNLCFRKVVYDQLIFSPVCIAACLLAAGIVEVKDAETVS